MDRRCMSLVAGVVAAALSLGEARADDTECAVKRWAQARQNPCANGGTVGGEAPGPDDVARLEPAWTFRPGGGCDRPSCTRPRTASSTRSTLPPARGAGVRVPTARDGVRAYHVPTE